MTKGTRELEYRREALQVECGQEREPEGTISSNEMWRSVLAIAEGGLKDVLVHPNQRRYPGQVVLVVAYRDYVFLVPSVEEDTHYFLKTIIPSRKATRDYLRTEGRDEEA